MLDRELSVVEFDELFKNVAGYERTGSTISIFKESGRFHFQAIGWRVIDEQKNYTSIINRDMFITIGHLSNNLSVNYSPGLS